MKIIRNILAIIGGIFLVLTVVIVMVILFKPYGIDIMKMFSLAFDKNPESSYDHPYLTTQQELLLESLGINPKDVPTELTSEFQDCAISILGEERVGEILSGGNTTISELLKLKGCITEPGK